MNKTLSLVAVPALEPDSCISWIRTEDGGGGGWCALKASVARERLGSLPAAPRATCGTGRLEWGRR